MLQRYQCTAGDALRGADACVMVLAWLTAYWSRFYLPFVPVTKGLPSFTKYAALAPVVAAVWLGVFTLLPVYDSGRMLSRWSEVQRMLKAHAVAFLLFIALTYLFDEYKYSRVVMLYFAVLGALAMILVRLVVRSVVRTLRSSGFNLRYVLAVGEGYIVETLIERFKAFPELGLAVCGIVTHENSPLVSIGERPVVGHFADIPRLIRTMHVDEVILALPPSQYHEVDRLLDLLKDETVDVRLVPDVHLHATLSCQTEDFDGLPIVRINDSPLTGWGALAKRCTDVVLSSVALVVLLPLLLLIALAVRLTSRGPVLFVQERTGLDGRTFRMLKFRSMRLDAEARTGPVWAQAGDERCTVLGALLRRTSLDELPQLWNVLLGDMSLVGPRPERPLLVDRFRNEIPHYMLRHKVKAGLTGWAQVNGWRGNTSLARRIECDLFYIRNWSYALDLKIMTLTLWKGFINKNAY